jgi:hypothetical protein
MISFSIDKQRDKVNAEWMSRPVGQRQPLVSVLTSMEQSPTFAYRLKRKLLSGSTFGEAYKVTVACVATNFFVRKPVPHPNSKIFSFRSKPTSEIILSYNLLFDGNQTNEDSRSYP